MKPLSQYTEEDIARLQARCDLWCRNVLVGTLILCATMTVATYVYLTLSIALS